MCGIAGIHQTSSLPLPRQWLLSMQQALHHRGPDEQGLRQSPGVGLIHTRLSIVDLSGGHQPLSNEDGRYWICFNGEIFNHEPLRRQLIQQGHVFKTRSDTEVIVHLFEQYGEACVDHLNGQFAFAIHDQVSNRLFLARDRVGIRPLFHTVWQVDGQWRFAFASEIKALLSLPNMARRFDLRGLAQTMNW